MRTYYFCTDTDKEMESWMRVMTDAALLQAEPVKRCVRGSDFTRRSSKIMNGGGCGWEGGILAKGSCVAALQTRRISVAFHFLYLPRSCTRCRSGLASTVLQVVYLFIYFTVRFNGVMCSPLAKCAHNVTQCRDVSYGMSDRSVALSS